MVLLGDEVGAKDRVGGHSNVAAVGDGDQRAVTSLTERGRTTGTRCPGVRVSEQLRTVRSVTREGAAVRGTLCEKKKTGEKKDGRERAGSFCLHDVAGAQVLHRDTSGAAAAHGDARGAREALTRLVLGLRACVGDCGAVRPVSVIVLVACVVCVVGGVVVCGARRRRSRACDGGYRRFIAAHDLWRRGCR